ncbi:hypothetical protein [Desulfospira joergensenii]|uniref:DUF6812 domain-containing protein n=1 Tax=Desulfospira joergensenii TaxID=53329 RepID=UPI0003B47204|nr:hypothetical protein [Desulfospira joergensenii]
MDNKIRVTEYRIIMIKLVDGTTINGQANINQEHGYDRLSDLVGSKKEEFLVLNGATVHQTGLKKAIDHPVLFVNKRHIIWCSPDENQK